jgi:hypothetical protein
MTGQAVVRTHGSHLERLLRFRHWKGVDAQIRILEQRVGESGDGKSCCSMMLTSRTW